MISAQECVNVMLMLSAIGLPNAHVLQMMLRIILTVRNEYTYASTCADASLLNSNLGIICTNSVSVMHHML